MTRNPRRDGLAVLAIVLLAVAVYLPGIGAPFFWDDRVVLERQLEFVSTPGAAFFPPVDVPEFSRSYYRPVVILSWQLDEAVTKLLFGSSREPGAREVVFHASNVAVHALTALVVLLLARRLLQYHVAGHEGGRWHDAAIVAGIIFAINPLHAEPVVWMSGRSDLWMGLFAAAALLAAVRAADGAPGWFAVSSAGLLLALLSKETALGIVPALLVIAWLEPNGRARRLAACAAAVIVALGSYGALRLAAGIDAGGVAERVAALPAALAAIGWTAWMQILPWPPLLFSQQRPGAAYVSFGAVVLLVIAALFVRRRSAIERVGLAWFGGGLVVAALPAIATVSRTPIAERYTYLATGGGALLIAAIWSLGSWRIPTRAIAAAAAAVACLLALTPRIALWRDPVALWRRASESGPPRALPLVQFGRALEQAGRADDAQEAYRLALELPPTDRVASALAANNFGSLRAAKRDMTAAIDSFRRAIELDPANPLPPLNLARALIETPPASRDVAQRVAQLEQAEALLRTAIGLAPRSVEPHALLGQLLAMLGRGAEARSELERAIALESDEAQRKILRGLLEGAR